MLNHIELAKECGGRTVDRDAYFYQEHTAFNDAQLTAYTNAIIEECAKVADDADLVITAENIRALKVGG